MTRGRIGWIVFLLLVVLLFIWIARHTYWADLKVQMPVKGEAATNPFYVQERFAQALGAHTQWNRGMSLPPGSGVAVIADWKWDLSDSRQQRLEKWVESGGRLVVDQSLLLGTDSFERWSGIGHTQREPATAAGATINAAQCSALTEQGSAHDSYTICGLSRASSLTSTRRFEWALGRREFGLQAIRVRVGAGSVTVINGLPFQGRELLDDDNGLLFVAATQLRPGDEIHFFSESHHATLLELAWQLGWPVFGLSAALLALLIWRSAARFGPLIAVTDPARRSLAEQIRGTGLFAMRIGSGGALRAAAARALHEAAALHLRAYQNLSATERVAALAAASGCEADALTNALNSSDSRRAEHLLGAIATLEAARRQILLKNTRSRHGNRDQYPQSGR